MSRSRAWCFTLNNYDGVLLPASFPKEPCYLCYGEEVGENGTPHLQGYVFLPNAVGLSFVRAVAPDAHWEVSRGSPEQNRDYCRKDGIFTEFGELPVQGKRNDLLAVRDSISAGLSIPDLAAKHFGPFIRYHRGVFLAYDLLSPLSRPRESPPRIEIHVGPTGCGKTRNAFAAYPDAWVSPPGPLQWFDGYNGQKSVILDEFHGGLMTYSSLLRLLDRYPLRLPIKGSFTNWRPDNICITTNSHPRHWYSKEVLVAHDCDSWETSPLRRRIKDFGTIFLYNKLLKIKVGPDQETIPEQPAIPRPAEQVEAPTEGLAEGLAAEPPAQRYQRSCLICGNFLDRSGSCLFCDHFDEED